MVSSLGPYDKGPEASLKGDGGVPVRSVLFPPGFLDRLEQSYVLSFVARPFVVHVPRPVSGVTLGGVAGVPKCDPWPCRASLTLVREAWPCGAATRPA